MPQPNLAYNSGNVPHGAFFANVYRLVDVENNAVANLLGVYMVEVITPQDTATLTKRPNTDGGKNGWFITNGDVEGSATFQRNVETTPYVQNGDFIVASLRVDAAGLPVEERFVLHGVSSPIDAGYRKQSASIIVDDTA